MLLSALTLLQVACVPTPPSVLSHALAFQRKESAAGLQELSLPPLTLRSREAVVVVSVGRGEAAFFMDQSSIPRPSFRQIGDVQHYSRWSSSGTALFASTVRGSDHTSEILVATPSEDEITVVAVAVAGTYVQDSAWVEQGAGYAVTSASVTTTGRATLVAFWWGDADVSHRKVAVPGNGFKVIESILDSGALVQCAVAVRQVDKAGSYTVTWYVYPRQGAQLWLVAIQ